MEILYLLIPMSVVLVFAIGGIFWWSVRSGQFEDLEGPGYRVLMDDDHTVENDLTSSKGFDTGQGQSRPTSTE